MSGESERDECVKINWKLGQRAARCRRERESALIGNPSLISGEK